MDQDRIRTFVRFAIFVSSSSLVSLIAESHAIEVCLGGADTCGEVLIAAGSCFEKLRILMSVFV